ncbi:MAG: tetratricopeptide repeat protein [Elusimicrobiota bacterium]
MRALDRLEQCREMAASEPQQALSLLPGRGALPAALRPERDFVAAEACRAMGLFKRSEALYRRVLRAADRGQDSVLWAEAALGSASGLRAVGETRSARRLLKAAGALHIAVFERRLQLEEALVIRAEGRYGESIRRLSKLLRGADREETAYLFWAIGGARRFAGDLSASRRAYLRSLDQARRCRDLSGVGYACLGLGGVCRIEGLLERSASYYRRAARVFRGTSDLFAKAYALCGLANACRQLGRLQEAARLYGRARPLYAALGDKPDLAYVDWGLGKTHLMRGDLRRAEARFRLSSKLFRESGEARGEVLSGLALSSALHSMGRTTEAERVFSAAYRLGRRTGLHAHLEIFT